MSKLVEVATHGIVIGLVTACASRRGDHLVYAEGRYRDMPRAGD